MELIESIRKKQITKHRELYNKESDKYLNNSICEARIIARYIHTMHGNTPQTQDSTDPTFKDLLPYLTGLHFGEHEIKGISKPTMPQLTSFIQLRNPITETKAHNPVYKSTSKLKRLELLRMAMECMNRPLNPRFFDTPALPPEDDDTSDEQLPVS